MGGGSREIIPHFVDVGKGEKGGSAPRLAGGVEVWGKVEGGGKEGGGGGRGGMGGGQEGGGQDISGWDEGPEDPGVADAAF